MKESSDVQRADALRKQALRAAVQRGTDVHGSDGRLHVGVGLCGDQATIITLERGEDGSIAAIDAREVQVRRSPLVGGPERAS